MSDHNSRPTRRRFLFTLGAGSAATAAAVLAKAAPKAQAAVATDRAPRGYRETAHVTRYYRTTRI